MGLRKAARMAAIAAAATGVAIGTAAYADHAWGSYAWDYSGGELPIPIVDNTSGVWPQHVSAAVADWNLSTVIEAPQHFGANPSCTMHVGTIEVCNDNYGANGWLGLATISLSNGKIIAGSTKLNDHYFSLAQYNNYSWRQLVTCQEIGHDYGLAHQNENFATDATTSCMEYTSWPDGNESPDYHDYDMLLAIYAGSGGGDTGGGGAGGGKGPKGDKPGNGKGRNKVALPNVGNTPETWGRPIRNLPNGVPHVFARNLNGVMFVTHVTWTREYLEEHGGEDGHSH